MGIIIRPIRVEDAQQLTNLVRSLGEFSIVTTEVPEKTLQRIDKHLSIIATSDRHTLLVAEDAGETVGYSSTHWQPLMSQQEGFISELFVASARRGEGIGTALLESIKEEAKMRDCGRLHLENFRTKASYERSYYTKHGWQERPAAASFIFDLIKEDAK